MGRQISFRPEGKRLTFRVRGGDGGGCIYAAPSEAIRPAVSRNGMAVTYLVESSGVKTCAEVGRRLQVKRIELGLRQADLAELLGVHPKTVGAWELGRKVPGVHHKNLLAEILGLSRQDQEDLNAVRKGEASESFGLSLSGN